jgi:tetratricopeptide (TPR) repeat protein
MARIFLSHSSEDERQAHLLLDWLLLNGFENVFLDFEKNYGLRPGAHWESTLYREIAGADAVILILTANWMASKWCFVEFAQARALGKHIFPLIESPTGETYVASDIQSLDLVKDREGGLNRLARELGAIALDARQGFEWDRSRPPYPGILEFQEADAAIYFGRDDDILRYIEHLNARRTQGGDKLVVLRGDSGSGKSSLLRAGVLPRLKRDKHNWMVLPPFRPKAHPMQEIALVLAGSAGGGAAEVDRWLRAFADNHATEALWTFAADLRAGRQANEATILVTIDQAEELFTQSENAEVRQLLAIIGEMCSKDLPFVIQASIRSDYLSEFQRVRTLTLDEFSLKPMPLDRVPDIIEGPARVAGVKVDRALVIAAQRDAPTEDALPLLAIALRELYDRFARTGELTLPAYQAMADPAKGLSPLENSVRQRADNALKEANPSEADLQALKDAFVPAMARISEQGEYVRQPARIDALPPRAHNLIQLLAGKRLLITSEQNGVPVVEVAHEALLRKWPLLRGWLDEEREFLIGKQQLERDLADWNQAAPIDKSAATLSGLKLSKAQTWLAARPHQLSEAERTFIRASIDQSEREKQKRERFRRALLGAAIAAAAVFCVLTALSVREWSRAENALETATDTANRLVLDLAGKLRNRAGMPSDLVRAILDRSADLQQKLLISEGGRTDLQISAARGLNEMILTLLEQSDARSGADVDAAKETAVRFRDIMAKLVSRDPKNANWQHLYSLSYNRVGDTLMASGRFSEALVAFETAYGIRQRLVDNDGENDDWQEALATSLLKIGDVRRTLGAYEDKEAAAELYDRSAAIRERLVARHPLNRDQKRELAVSHERKGAILLSLAEYEAALTEFNKALLTHRSLAETDPQDGRAQRDLAIANDNAGVTVAKLGKHEQALELLTNSLNIRQKLAGDNPNGQLQRDLAVSFGLLGDIEAAAGNNSEAIAWYGKGLSAHDRLIRGDPNNAVFREAVIKTLIKLADLNNNPREFLQRCVKIAEVPKPNPAQSDWARLCRDRLVNLPP